MNYKEIQRRSTLFLKRYDVELVDESTSLVDHATYVINQLSAFNMCKIKYGHYKVALVDAFIITMGLSDRVNADIDWDALTDENLITPDVVELFSSDISTSIVAMIREIVECIVNEQYDSIVAMVLPILYAIAKANDIDLDKYVEEELKDIK